MGKIKIKINAIIDLLMLLFFLPSFFSGIVLFKIFPTGSGFQGGRNLFFEENYFLNLGKDQWTKTHNLTSLIFAGLLLTHFFLHLYWLKTLPKIFKKGGQS